LDGGIILNVLLVDDEKIFIDDIMSSIDWNKLDIDDTFSALNIRKAKEIIETEHIDIVLCDIEMPQGNGLELLAWIKDHYSYIESIILTCHVDFTYAQQALKVGCMDYILKPIQNDVLETAIQKAIKRIDSSSYLQQYSRFGEYWIKYHSVISEKFWIDLIGRAIGPDPQDIEKEAKERNIPYSADVKYLPILFSVKNWLKKCSPYDKKMKIFGLKNIACETILSDGLKGQILELSDDKFLLLIPLQINKDINLDHIKYLCSSCIVSCQKHFECNLACYLENCSSAFGLPDAVDNLIELDKENISYENQVFLLSEFINHAVFVQIPDMKPWSVMLFEGKADTVISEINEYFSGLTAKKYLNADLLKQFLQDFMQMIYKLFESNGIPAHQILDNKEPIELYENATRSLGDLMSWLTYAVNLSVSLLSFSKNSDEVIERIKNYIDMNLNFNITREDLAEKFFINADYLDRVFKKEFGFTVTKYMCSQRISLAKRLLSETNVNVSDIATSLGFTNFSHFSTVFKKLTLLSPSEYRKWNA
jgi:two-component system, response regulator YesN